MRPPYIFSSASVGCIMSDLQNIFPCINISEKKKSSVKTMKQQGMLGEFSSATGRIVNASIITGCDTSCNAKSLEDK